MEKAAKSGLLFAVLLTLAILGIYLPGIHNELLFDDLRLGDGTIFGEYGSLLDFKQRMVSYGSFVWVQSLVGEGWWKQRLFNITLHLGTVACLYALWNALLTSAKFPRDFVEQEHFAASRAAALRVGVALFALNPVAVYAVGYLVQRSIVMATLFAVLSCWLFVRGLQTGRATWHAAAFASYVIAVLSKEYALLTVTMAVPLYLYVRRPTWKAVLAVALGCLAVLGVAAAAFMGLYGQVIGKVFDPRSVALVQQLEAIRPGVASYVYPLSILNEAKLFFSYGFLWFIPNVQWMSVDLRPAFPLGFSSLQHLLGAAGYLGLIGTASWLVLRKRDVLGLVGVCLMFPLLWFITEFATVWIQDPFVLYRSYLWAVAVPGVIAIALTGFKPRTIYTVGVLVALVFGTLALERNSSLRDEGAAWADAAEKIDLQAPSNAVGRSRPYLNLGAYYLDKGSLHLAERALIIADALGDLGGNARFNLGVTWQQQKKHKEALQAFAAAQVKGFDGQPLYYHRGESAFAVGQYDLAYQSFTAALTHLRAGEKPDKNMEMLLQLRRADAALATQQYDTAIADFQALLNASPNQPKLLVGLGMALVGKGDTEKALALFEQLVASASSAIAYYGRGVARHRAGKVAEGLSDIDEAIKREPNNAQFRQARDQLASAAKPAVKPKP